MNKLFFIRFFISLAKPLHEIFINTVNQKKNYDSDSNNDEILTIHY